MLTPWPATYAEICPLDLTWLGLALVFDLPAHFLSSFPALHSFSRCMPLCQCAVSKSHISTHISTHTHTHLGCKCIWVGKLRGADCPWARSKGQRAVGVAGGVRWTAMCACERIVKLITRFVGNYRYDPNQRTTIKSQFWAGSWQCGAAGRGKATWPFVVASEYQWVHYVWMPMIMANWHDTVEMWKFRNSVRDVDKGGPQMTVDSVWHFGTFPPPKDEGPRRRRRPLTITASICRHLGGPFPSGKLREGRVENLGGRGWV